MSTRQELADKWRSDLLKVQGDELTIELGRRGASELLELLNLPDPDPAKDIVKATIIYPDGREQEAFAPPGGHIKFDLRQPPP